MIGETIKWRIKIVNKRGVIRLGIGLKTVLKNNELNNNHGLKYDQHGCYVVSCGGVSLTYLDK